MKKYFVKEYTTAGKRTVINGMQNQDNITVYEDDNILLVCVSDGCTNAEYPVEAGKINGQVAIKASKVIWTMPEKKVKQYLSDCYNEVFSNTDFPYRQLCATTAFIMINKAIGAYRAFSVGDTAVLSYNSTGQFRMFLEPVNAFRKSATYFTNDSLSVKKFSQFRQGTTDDIAGFVIYSDGAESIAQPPYTDIKRLVSSAYCSDEAFSKENTKLFEKLRELDDDDISIAILAVSDDVIPVNMKQIYSGFSPDFVTETEKTEQNIDIDILEDKQPEVMLKDVSEKADFINFLREPRYLNEIVSSKIIEKDDIVKTLVDFVRRGIVLCITDGRFLADLTETVKNR